MKRIFSVLLTVAFIGYAIYSRVPKYEQFTNGTLETGPNEFSYFEISSAAASNVKVVISGQDSAVYDAYLLSDAEMQKLNAWMASDDLSQPDIATLGKWESVNLVDQADILMPEGKFFLIIDNTIFGTERYSDVPFVVEYRLYEKI